MENNQIFGYLLRVAVLEGDLERAREFIYRLGLSHSQAWSEGYVLLREALQYKQAAVAKLLLENGSEVNSKNSTTINPSDTPLHFAVINGDIEIVKMILDRGADIEAKNRSGRTPLHFAILYKKIEVFELLLKYKADVNASDNYGTTPLHNAIVNKNIEITELLLKYKADANASDKYGTRPIHAAVQIIGCLQIVEHLLTFGADVNCVSTGKWQEGYTSLHFAVEKGNKEIVSLLLNKGANVDIKGEDNVTPLHIAAKKGFRHIAEDLLNHGACINSCTLREGNTPLHLASERGNEKAVKLFLNKGANINAIDEYGRTALHSTALYVQSRDNIKGETAKLLLSKGANVDAQTKDGETTLYDAIRNEYAEVVEALLEYNANANFKAKGGITPLHISAQRGNKKISTMLLNRGANVNAKQENGTTALHIAVKLCHREVLKLLLESGAEVDSKMDGDITPLHFGALFGYPEIVETILKFGASIDSRDKDGRTALHLASQKGHGKVVDTLLEYGSDINITNINNQTPLDDAIAEIRSLHIRLCDYNNADDDDRSRSIHHAVCSREITVEALKRHIIKMKKANLYVSEKNLLSMHSSGERSDFQDECEKEIASMKREKINNLNISFYDILAQSISLLAIYMKNENIVRVLKSDDYKTKFPIYASMIKNNFRKGLERKELFEQGNKIFHLLFNNFPELPYDCTEKIFSYLSNEDLRIVMDACKPLSTNNPSANINDAVITSSIS